MSLGLKEKLFDSFSSLTSEVKAEYIKWSRIKRAFEGQMFNHTVTFAMMQIILRQ